MDYDVRGRTIVVTGGASGIGLAVVRLALEQGARVGLLDASAANMENCLAGLAPGERGRVSPLVVDVRDPASLRASVDEIERAQGPITGLVASAGVTKPQRASEITTEAWDLVIGVNLTGMFNTVQVVSGRMLERGRGSIVAVASTDAFGGHAARAQYAASKHGVVGLVRTCAIEWGRQGVRVNAIAPGVVDTPLLRANVPPEHLREAMLDRVPLARFSAAAEQAHAAMFLLSDGASYVNGATLAVDGGLTAGFFTRWSGEDLGSVTLLRERRYARPVQDEDKEVSQ